VWLFVLTAYAHLIPALNRVATAMLASVSIASVVFGLAAQSTLANLIAGVSLVFYKPFRMGDELQLTAPTGVETGTVEHMSLGHTTLRTIDDRRVNSTMLNQVILTSGPRVRADS
jgi:small conductance mechanosensitive channel